MSACGFVYIVVTVGQCACVLVPVIGSCAVGGVSGCGMCSSCLRLLYMSRCASAGGMPVSASGMLLT